MLHEGRWPLRHDLSLTGLVRGSCIRPTSPSRQQVSCCEHKNDIDGLRAPLGLPQERDLTPNLLIQAMGCGHNEPLVDENGAAKESPIMSIR